MVAELHNAAPVLFISKEHRFVRAAFQFLQQQEIIYNQRGIGYFVAPKAYTNALNYRKEEFLQKDLPGVFRNMYLLGMNTDELKPRFEKFIKQNFS